jgi:hypothetical protein
MGKLKSEKMEGPRQPALLPDPSAIASAGTAKVAVRIARHGDLLDSVDY